MMNSGIAAVSAAIKRTKGVLGEYFQSTLTQRLEGGAGSIFEGVKTPEEMERFLASASWEEVSHPAVMPGCRAFRSWDIPGGRLGVIRVKDCDEDSVFVADDRKNTGKVSITIKGIPGPKTGETWLILGHEEGIEDEVVFTFHPGPPIRPSRVEVKDCPHGAFLTKAEALALGFEWVKII